jgi:hypothetical protein
MAVVLSSPAITSHGMPGNRKRHQKSKSRAGMNSSANTRRSNKWSLSHDAFAHALFLFFVYSSQHIHLVGDTSCHVQLATLRPCPLNSFWALSISPTFSYTPRNAPSGTIEHYPMFVLFFANSPEHCLHSLNVSLVGIQLPIKNPGIKIDANCAENQRNLAKNPCL